jgi:hypothetical protein
MLRWGYSLVRPNRQLSEHLNTGIIAQTEFPVTSRPLGINPGQTSSNAVSGQINGSAISSSESRLAKRPDLLQPIVWIRTEPPNTPASRRWIRYILGESRFIGARSPRFAMKVSGQAMGHRFVYGAPALNRMLLRHKDAHPPRGLCVCPQTIDLKPRFSVPE